MPEVPPTDVTNRMTTVVLNGPTGLWEGHENCSLVDGKKKRRKERLAEMKLDIVLGCWGSRHKHC